MSFTLAGRTHCVSAILSRLVLARSTSKIAVELDAELLQRLENNELKPRQHPGAQQRNRVQLPPYITRGIERAVRDHPVKALLVEAKKLNLYINARHPPPEQHEMQTKMRDIVALADERMPPQQMTDMSEAEVAAWRRKRDQFIQRLIQQRTYAWKPIAYDAYQALVYAIGRGAFEYGALVRILEELAARDVAFRPRSYFDFGSGVGTGMWAASSLWRDTIFEYFNVDSARDMHDLAELVLRGGNDNQEMALRNVYFRQFLPGLETKYDLVVSSFSLFELPGSQQRKEVIMNLWRKCDGYLVIVEEGTRRGSELINEARRHVLRHQHEPDLAGYVFAPCAHDLRCPRLAAQDDRTPCNFEVAYAPLRIGDQLSNRQTALYSYVVLKKGHAADEPTREWPRLVRPTLVRSKHAICRMCTAEGKLQEIIFTQSKHGRPAYRCAKASRWGDRLPIAVGETYETPKRVRKTHSADDAAATTAETAAPVVSISKE